MYEFSYALASRNFLQVQNFFYLILNLVQSAVYHQAKSQSEGGQSLRVCLWLPWRPGCLGYGWWVWVRSSVWERCVYISNICICLVSHILLYTSVFIHSYSVFLLFVFLSCWYICLCSWAPLYCSKSFLKGKWKIMDRDLMSVGNQN